MKKLLGREFFIAFLLETRARLSLGGLTISCNC